MKKFYLIFVFVLMLTIIISTNISATEWQSPIEFLEVFSGSMGGSWYPVGAETAAILRENIPNLDTRVAPGGGTANPGIIQDGEGLLGMTYTGTAFEAFQGVGNFDKPHEDLRHIVSLYSMPFIWITLRENDIETVDDLKNKRISPGRTGQTGLRIAEESLGVCGISFESIKEMGGTVSLLGDSDRLNMLRDRNLDAVSGLFPLTHAEIQSLNITPGIKLIKMDDEKLDKLIEKVPGLAKVKIPAGTFNKYQEDDVYTVVAVTCLIGHKSLDDELVYRILKAIVEQNERYNKYFPAEDNTIEFQPLIGNKIPVHPGALKYYKEKGLID